MTVHPFVTGGPVPSDASVYIERDADDKARRHLTRMEYITFIEPRQQGKTSLIHRLARTLSPGYVFAYANAMRLDKTDETAWYASLCRKLLRKIRIISQTDHLSLPHNGSTWGDFMTYMAERAEAAGQYLIIALDELGDVWMDWRVGFFSNIRAIFDERPNEPCFQHLTFILAGTYNPRVLMSDPRTSPFNVAQRVHLPDFTLAQTGQLVVHLEFAAEDVAAVAQRIHYWTDGQPYLTQRLCRTLAEGETPVTLEGVNLAVGRLHREDSNHLPRILEALDPEKHPRLRGYVERVLAGHRPQFRPASEGRYHGPLALIGVLKADEDGKCKVRNRIYEQALQGAVEMPHEPSFTALPTGKVERGPSPAERLYFPEAGEEKTVTVPSELREEMRGGNCILFIGAGLSIGAGLPSWKGLVQEFAEEVGCSPDEDYLKIAQFFENKFGRRALISKVRKLIRKPGVEPTENHYLITRLPIKVIFTTNYDELLENALRTCGIGYHCIVSDKGISYWSEDELQLVKMHGSVDDEESIVVTEDDYAKYFRQHPSIRRQLASLLAARTFLFIGYSLSDPDFNFIYDEIRFDLEEHQRYAYSVQLRAKPLELDNWKRKHVHVINLDKPGDVTAFLRELST